MKKLYVIITLLILLVGCYNDDTTEDLRNMTEQESVYGKWVLKKLSNTSTGAATTPDRDNSHFYQFNNDRTFKRVSKSEELEGVYQLSDESEHYGNENDTIKKFIELSYSSKVAFFNCNIVASDKELLILISDNSLQNTLDGACNGINCEYTKEAN